MSDSSIPVVILSERRDDVEFFNKTMRDAGHAVRCRQLAKPDELEDALTQAEPHLMVFFADAYKASVREIAKAKQSFARMAPLVVIRNVADEAAIGEALRDGAQDLVSMSQRERLCAVCERELRAYRLERALNDTLNSAAQYKKQLKRFMAGSTDAIAQVQEGIVVDVNQAWADVFAGSKLDDAQGPLMDYFAAGSHAALKGALIACRKGQWDGDRLKVDALDPRGKTYAVELKLEQSVHDGEPATRLSILRQPAAPAPGPETLVTQAAHTDSATGFYNRQFFLARLTDKLDRRAQGGARALAFIRPDKFGDIERQVGPISSEEILAQLAELLGRLTGENDLTGRFGGTIFAIVLERGSLRDIEAWAENAVSRISEHLFEVAEHSLSLTCTVGLAELGSGTDLVADLLKNAERANRRGRREGGNRVVTEETRDESTRVKRIDALWIRQIKSALVDGRFRLVHLNIASLSGQSERMFDTVLRMVDEQGEEIAASDFMATAKRNKLLRAVDRWVIGASIAFCKRQTNDLVFVKLSHESMLDPTLCGWIEEQLKNTGVKAGNLCFQVSEDDASRYQKQAMSLAQELKCRGFKFAIEHFGVGRDPIRVLENIAMDFVKFDGSLMQRIAADHPLQDKLRALVGNAARRKIKTIATRVENANTMAVLFQLGVGYMQGHYLHEPEVVLEGVV